MKYKSIVISVCLSFLCSFVDGSNDYLDLPIEKPIQAKKSPSTTAEESAEESEEEPPTFFGEEIENVEKTLIYVIDQSGSMRAGRFSAIGLDGTVRHNLNRMKVAILETQRSILELPSYFKVDILAYSHEFLWWKGKLTQMTDENKADALNWVSKLTPSGGTNTGTAVVWALQLEPTNKKIILLSDGDPSEAVPDPSYANMDVFEAHRTYIRNNNYQKASIDTFGIQASGLFEKFLINIAVDNNGSYNYAL